jgi:Fe2+ transport system protein FeoA
MFKANKTLIDLKEGEQALISSINGGWRANKRLADLGLTPGVKVKVIKKLFSGPIEMEVCDSRLVVGRGIASKVLIDVK